VKPVTACMSGAKWQRFTITHFFSNQYSPVPLRVFHFLTLEQNSWVILDKLLCSWTLPIKLKDWN